MMKVLIFASLYGLVHAFTPRPGALFLARSTTTTTALEASSSSSVVVISPPGGVGEVAAVKAASMGALVRWFVVGSGNNDEATQVVELAPHALAEIAAAGGEVQLAGADTPDLLTTSSSSTAIPAVSMWCGPADSLICVFDASLGGGGKKGGAATTGGDEVTESMWKDAVKVAAREAATQITGKKIAVLAADDGADEDAEETGGSIGGLVGGLLGGGDKVDVPETLASAMASDPKQIISLRHGQLFGTPESSPDFSALIGGPLKDPELCEEYYTRSIRVDPTVSVSGNMMMGETTRSSRHAVGEAAALLALEKVTANGGLDVCLTSLRGNDPVSVDEWQKELDRVAAMSMASVASGNAIPLFATEFSSVPDVKRLTDWLATKWAPAVLRTYDIAAIRTGGRPVYASKSDDTTVEIVWQELVNFESINTGKMVLRVSDTGLVASRASGDAAKGYSKVSRTPLAGEDVLVRRLAEASSQAIEKGLAKKVRLSLQMCIQKENPILYAHTVLRLLTSTTTQGGTRQGGSTTQEEKGGTRSSGRVYHSSLGRCGSGTCTQQQCGRAPASWSTPFQRTCAWFSQTNNEKQIGLERKKKQTSYFFTFQPGVLCYMRCNLLLACRARGSR